MIHNAAHEALIELANEGPAWNDDTMLLLATQFITDEGLVDKFRESLEDQAAEEMLENDMQSHSLAAEFDYESEDGGID